MDVLDAEKKDVPKDASMLPCKLCAIPHSEKEKGSSDEFPHADKFKGAFVFDDGEPNISEDEERPEQYEPTQWKKENREPWQLHNGLGPNLEAERSSNAPDPLPEVVNPQDHKWGALHGYFKEFAPEAF